MLSSWHLHSLVEDLHSSDLGHLSGSIIIIASILTIGKVYNKSYKAVSIEITQFVKIHCLNNMVRNLQYT